MCDSSTCSVLCAGGGLDGKAEVLIQVRVSKPINDLERQKAKVKEGMIESRVASTLTSPFPQHGAFLWSSTRIKQSDSTIDQICAHRQNMSPKPACSPSGLKTFPELSHQQQKPRVQVHIMSRKKYPNHTCLEGHLVDRPSDCRGGL